MARRYYFSMPLSEVVERRKEYYLGQVEKALDALYKKADASTIERYERTLHDLSLEIAGGKLERKVSRVGSKPKRVLREDPRPELNYKTYVQARNHGLTNDDIKAWFQTDSRRQVAGFTGAYSRYKSKYAKKKR